MVFYSNLYKYEVSNSFYPSIIGVIFMVQLSLEKIVESIEGIREFEERTKQKSEDWKKESGVYDIVVKYEPDNGDAKLLQSSISNDILNHEKTYRKLVDKLVDAVDLITEAVVHVDNVEGHYSVQLEFVGLEPGNCDATNLQIGDRGMAYFLVMLKILRRPEERNTLENWIIDYKFTHQLEDRARELTESEEPPYKYAFSDDLVMVRQGPRLSVLYDSNQRKYFSVEELANVMDAVKDWLGRLRFDSKVALDYVEDKD